MTTQDDRWHRSMYEQALQCAGVAGPDWDDLTDAQRENIRVTNYQHRDFMDALGKSIREGTEPPSIGEYL